MKNIKRSVLSSCFIDTENAPPMEGIFFVPIFTHTLKDNSYICRLFCERDSSGTTEAANGGEGDGADSPTRAPEGREAARPNKNEE